MTRASHLPVYETRYGLYRDSTAVTHLKKFEGRGHSLTIDHGWKDVADEVLTWLRGCGI